MEIPPPDRSRDQGFRISIHYLISTKGSKNHNLRRAQKIQWISIPLMKFIECDATTIDSAKSQQLVVGVFYFLTWHDMDVRRHAFFALELLTLNEKKLSLVSSGESLVLIHELPNLNHQILIINHSVPWLNLTSLGKQSPFPYFMTFDWLQILSRNLNITGKTVQQHKSRHVRLIWQGPLEFQHKVLPFSCAETRKSRFKLSEWAL